MKRAIIIILFVVSVFLCKNALADETLTITTYYPSPYGSYNELRAKRMAIGDNYVDAATYPWAGTYIPTAADLMVEGKVAIGMLSQTDYVTNSDANLQVNGGIRAAGGKPTSCHSCVNSSKSDSTCSIAGYSADCSNVGFTFDWNGDTGMFDTPTSSLASPSGSMFMQDDIVFMNDSVEIMRLQYGGKVGIGTTAPQSELDVVGSVAVGSSYAGVSAAPTNGMIVQGNVGIGTTSPEIYDSTQSNLDVNGYAAAKDVYLSEPKSGETAHWASKPTLSSSWVGDCTANPGGTCKCDKGEKIMLLDGNSAGSTGYCEVWNQGSSLVTGSCDDVSINGSKFSCFK